MSKFVRVYPTSVKNEEYKFDYLRDMYINLSNIEMISTEENYCYETGAPELKIIFISGRVRVLQYDDCYKRDIDYQNIIDAMEL